VGQSGLRSVRGNSVHTVRVTRNRSNEVQDQYDITRGPMGLACSCFICTENEPNLNLCQSKSTGEWEPGKGNIPP
jgi:hypothetical protein